eukprot:scaffold320952_cov30-Tisochrysis_lutea.AAC.2
MLSSSSATLQDAALTLLAMLCSHRECREQATDAGVTPPLVMLLSSPKREVQRAALALTQQLCGWKRSCDALLEAGAASPLAAMLQTSSAGSTEVSCVRSLGANYAYLTQTSSGPFRLRAATCCTSPTNGLT